MAPIPFVASFFSAIDNFCLCYWILSEQVDLFYKIPHRLFSALIKHIRKVGAHSPSSGQPEPTFWITYGSPKSKTTMVAI
jgi:hypothetical protein